MRSFEKTWKITAMAIGVGIVAGGAGCATTSTSALAGAQGTEDVTNVCSGIPADQRELGLLSYRSAIGGTMPLRERVLIGKTMMVDKDVGVQIAVRAQPGMTAPWLARVASCHAALAAANQIEAPNAKSDPLLVRGVQVSVQEAYTGFIVSIRGTDPSTVPDVINRATAMATAPSGPATAQTE